MRKLNAFIFVCCYLLLSKVVFSAEVELANLKLKNCESKEYRKYYCSYNGSTIFVAGSDYGFTAFTKDGETINVSQVKSIKDGDRVIFSSNARNSRPFPEEARVNKIIYADLAATVFAYSEVPAAKELVALAKKIAADKDNIIKDNLKIATADGKNSYECRRGATRTFTQAELDLQKKYNVKYSCNYFSCTGKDPSEKALMLLPKPGNSTTSPNILSMKNGAAQFQEGGFKVYDDAPGVVASYEKVVNDDEAVGLPEADVNPDLFIPSKYDNSKSSYSYLMNLAKRDFKDRGQMDMCADKELDELFAEQKKIGLELQDYLTKAELIEYLKLVDGSIGSYYVDRKKAQTLGCLYQNKIVDKSVMDRFDHLKEISVVKPSARPLSPDEIQTLFKKAKAMKDIPFGYKYDGCYARAHIMAKRFEEMGIATQKAWIKGSLYVPGTDIEWGYHVAPTIEVKEKTGKIVNYVIDPSLTDKAVPLDEWVAAMGKKAKGPIMKTTYPFPSNGLDFERTAVAISPSDVYGPMDMPDMTAAQKMEISKQRLQQFTEVLAAQGKN